MKIKHRFVEALFRFIIVLCGIHFLCAHCGIDIGSKGFHSQVSTLHARSPIVNLIEFYCDHYLCCFIGCFTLDTIDYTEHFQRERDSYSQVQTINPIMAESRILKEN